MLLPTPASAVNPAGIPPASVRLIGDPALRQACAAVQDFASPGLREDCARLAATLEHFRATNGFGRAIAAPQIGIPWRIVALNLGAGPFVLLNPVITARSAETFTLWDDCMSFPWLLVRLRRHRTISIQYADLEGTQHAATDLDPALSELLQHELDHLDGILALDRALDARAIIARAVYEADRQRYDVEVDYSIAATIEKTRR